MSRQLKITSRVTDLQRRAADPRGSVWVRANAGSGKTHVLTERVLRLLLAGVRPEEILCLTYTKAAAAEMRRRVAGRLAEWALMDDGKLADTLAAMEDRPPTPEAMARARTLFAHALETPGGLKINTIHAFCESVLHRFPLEAGVPFDFAVLEEGEAEDMVRKAREWVIAEGVRGRGDLVPAVEALLERLTDSSLQTTVATALADARKLRPVLADRLGSKRRLRRFVGVPPELTVADVRGEIINASLLAPGDIRTVVSICRGKPSGSRFADLLSRADPDRPSAEQLLAAFLTDSGELRKTLLPSAERKENAALAERLEAEQGRLYRLNGRLIAAKLAERSEALIDVLGAIDDHYQGQKRARSLLDFDDLVRQAAALFADEALSAWVRYKLDAGITHILVDESQDTNPEQWRVVDALATEFFAGHSAAQRLRTLFAVGDEKQSIYSFQGADPRLFGESGRRYGRAAKHVQHLFRDMELKTSFRTLAGVLAAVDLVFKDDRLREAVLAIEPVIHDSARAESGGTVTLWPPIAQEDDAVDPDNWPVEASSLMKSAPRRLAERIAGEIRRWLDTRRPLGPRGQAVRADDILILVQSRSALFRELIRALAKFGVPSPGADRLQITEHIAVLDLLALGDVLLTPNDDLQLAAVLRSPLFEVSEDDLFALAAERGGSLWQALQSTTVPSAAAACAKLHRWRGRLDFDRPFSFFAEVLYADGGLKRFHGRLGAEVDDVLAEFLELAMAHEQTPQPSLQGFIAEMRASEISVRRELAESGGGVRVMTVHGAKGLEAPIVILADAASRPQPGQTIKPVFIVPDAPDGPFLVHATGREHTPETKRLRQAAEAAEDAEYWRRLYVAMTRAEDELYVTGVLTKTDKPDGTWYQAIDKALAEEAHRVEDAEGNLTALLYPPPSPALLALVEPQEEPPPLPRPLTLPPLPTPVVVPIVQPSAAYEGQPDERTMDTATESLVGADAARRTGIALHALLQHLWHMPAESWHIIGQKAVATLLPDADKAGQSALVEKATSILARPEFAALFGPNSRAEVPFLVDAKRDGKPVRFTGRIDRIVVEPGRVLVVDYKSDAVPPRIPSDVPASYLTQVGLYAHVASQLFPGMVIEAGILWTHLESLMILPQTKLRDAVSAFTTR